MWKTFCCEYAFIVALFKTVKNNDSAVDLFKEKITRLRLVKLTVAVSMIAKQAVKGYLLE